LAKDLDFTPFVTLSSGKSMTDALKTMREKGTKRIAVIKDGQLLGMLTQDIASVKSSLTSKTHASK